MESATNQVAAARKKLKVTSPWVMRGSLVHHDSMGHSGVIYPGLAQRMSAGTGILHSEKNDAWRLDQSTHEESVHFIEMWVVPDERAVTPSYEQLEIDPSRLAGALVTVASGMARDAHDTAIRIQNRHAALRAARLEPGDSVVLPDAPFTHLFVPRGVLDLEETGELTTGDAVRLRRGGARRVTAVASSEILIWEMHATIAP